MSNKHNGRFLQHLWKKNTLFGRSACFIVVSIIFTVTGLLLLGQSSFIRAQSSSQRAITGVDGIPNQVEYLSSLKFMDTNTYEIQADWFVASGTNVPTLLVSGAVTAGQSNVNQPTSFIGGGTGNTVVATNVVILGGASNAVESENGVILGGIGNEIAAGAPSTLVAGGENNHIKGGSSALILGGGGNTSTNGIILGMSNNIIHRGTNTIVAGSNIMVPFLVENVFVWSDSATGFSPDKSNAFYINTQNGVGINTPNPQTIFDSNGAVKIGETTTTACNADNVGVVTFTGGCMCACTDQNYWTSVSDDKGKCVSICNQDPSCKYIYEETLNTGTNEIIGSGSWVGACKVCIDPVGRSKNTELCSGAATNIKTSTEKRLYSNCPTSDIAQLCAYTCKSGYTYDAVTNTCELDCHNANNGFDYCFDIQF